MIDAQVCINSSAALCITPFRDVCVYQQRTIIPALNFPMVVDLNNTIDLFFNSSNCFLCFFLLWSLFFFTETNVSVTDHAIYTSN